MASKTDVCSSVIVSSRPTGLIYLLSSGQIWVIKHPADSPASLTGFTAPWKGTVFLGLTTRSEYVDLECLLGALTCLSVYLRLTWGWQNLCGHWNNELDKPELIYRVWYQSARGNKKKVWCTWLTLISRRSSVDVTKSFNLYTFQLVNSIGECCASPNATPNLRILLYSARHHQLTIFLFPLCFTFDPKAILNY